ncbi:MAG: DUF6371 domain-containing protein [Chlorobium phaeovibrioides]|nr:DUF6371 domain-containing protein [Chlorobium phaeovibrioides]
MDGFRFGLECGGIKHICPACKQRRFVRSVDSETGLYIADEVGRCDREDSCGYHLTPKEYFRMRGQSPSIHSKQVRPRPSVSEPEPSCMPNAIMRASIAAYDQNNFYQWLCRVFGEAKAFELAGAYRLGTSKHWPGASVFWQIDEDGRIRAGKVMLYHAGTGRRVKEPFNHIQWAHKLLQVEPYHLRQCLFGLQLVMADPSKPVAVVESEKTAMVASGFIPDFIWTATSGKGNLTVDRLNPLRGRQIILFPDLGATDKWREKAGKLPGVWVSDALEQRATASDRAAGVDVADYLLREHTKDVQCRDFLMGIS